MNRLFAVATCMLACLACSKTEIDFNKVIDENEPGVYAHFAPFLEEDTPGTRGYSLTNFAYDVEVGDRISVWSTQGTQQIFLVTERLESGDHFVAKIEASGFSLNDGEEYYAFYPFVIPNVVEPLTAQKLTWEGQTQTNVNAVQNGGKTELRELGKYDYSWAKATSENGKTQFSFKRFSTFFLVEATLPRTGMTIRKITITANKPLFALNGTADVTTGEFTPTGQLSETLTMNLNDVTVDGNVLTAYLASAPVDAATYVIRIEDNNGKVYVSPEFEKAARPANDGKYAAFRFTAESEEREYVKVTSIDPEADAAGKYILVYPNGTTYRAFSFTKAMENAEAAGELAKDTHGLENILAMGSQLYATVVANNCIDVEGPANAESLILTPDQEKEAAFDVSLLDADHAWDLVDGKVTLSATTQKGKSYSIGVDHAVVNVNGNADVVVAFNAPDVINAMKAIRGTDLPVDFDYLINLAVAQAMKEGITFTPAQIARLKSGFEHLCVLAKSMVASHPEVFQGGTLMDINLSTNVFDVVGRYYDNATQMSWSIAPQKRFGLATLGYHAYDKGFTFNVGLPQAGWFNRLEASLKNDLNNDGVLQVEECVAYWKQFDSQYNLGIPNFFERASRRTLSELDSTTLAMLQQMAAGGKFAAIGNVYKQYADRFNDELEPVYIYKKVE